MKRIKLGMLNEFEIGILWNYAATFLMAVNGFICNFIIEWFYDASAVGLFNRIYAYYLIISQLSVFGLHMSLMHQVPTLKDKREQNNSLTAALAATLVVASAVSALLMGGLYFLRSYIGASDRQAIANIAAALVFFSINKVIIFFFNGMSLMKEHAILQIVRYVGIGGSVLVLALWHVAPEYLVLCFLISEICVFAVGMLFLWRHQFCKFRIQWEYIKGHISFGRKIFLSNLVLNLNTKVDIISLGFVLNDDYYIGIYSFAVMFAEGFYQLLVVVRRSVNPKITQYYYGLHDNLADLKRARKLTDALAFLAFVGILAGYLVICLLMGNADYYQGIISVFLIGISIVLTRKQILYGNIFAQTGKPVLETRINVITVGVNIVFNFIMIPLLGMNGAALATGISYATFAIMLNCVKDKQDQRLCDILHA